MTPQPDRRETAELLDRRPPSDVDAEQRYLGCCILDGSVVERESVDPADFHVEAHGRMAEALANYPGPWPISAAALRGWLPPEQWEAVGGAAGIAEICGGVGYIGHAGRYAERIRAAAAKRRIITRLCDGLRHCYNGSDDPGALLAELTASLESIADGQQAERFPRMTCAELDAATLEVRYLVDGLLVADQPGIIAGPKKALKTSIVIDLSLSLASGTPFLGAFSVPESIRVGLMSGESGQATIQETARRISVSKGFALGDVDGLWFCDSLPQLGSTADLAALRRFIRRDRLEVLILDPTYLMMTGEGAENMFKQGVLLRPITDLGQATGCTVLLVHHTRKNISNEFQPPELENIAWSGFQEWARQWLLIGRRERYEPGSGEHRLWLNWGGSAGHSGLWALEVWEGTAKDIGGRKWEVQVKQAAEARQDAQERLLEAQEETEALKLERDKERLYAALAKAGNGDTITTLRDRSGIHTRQFRKVLAMVLEEGGAVACEVVKRGRTYEGYRLGEKPDE